jgi:hypothetical protein
MKAVRHQFLLYFDDWRWAFIYLIHIYVRMLITSIQKTSPLRLKEVYLFSLSPVRRKELKIISTR